MAQDKLQLQRWELKYIVSESTALAMRDFVRSYLEVDEYGVSRPDWAYPVHSLYLDSGDLRCYWDTINGTKNRYKLRLRYYDNRPDSPVFFEIKRRVNSCILKQRGGVRRNAVPWLVHGQLPQPEHLLSKETKYFVALQRFCRLMSDLVATPKVHISYLREAWVSHNDNSVRVTFDRQVRAALDTQARLSIEHEGDLVAFGTRVILELKFTDRYPHWLREMVRCFNLFQCGAAKYCEGVNSIGEPTLRRSHGYLGLETTGTGLGEEGEASRTAAAENNVVLEAS